MNLTYFMKSKKTILFLLSIVLITQGICQGQSPTNPNPAPPDGLKGQKLRTWLKKNWYDNIYTLPHGSSAALNYLAARQHLYGNVFCEPGDTVEDVYGGYRKNIKGLHNKCDLPSAQLGTPKFTTEHLVPQSFFNYSNKPKSDLHHLFPVYSRWNSVRQHRPYAIIDNNVADRWMKKASAIHKQFDEYEGCCGCHNGSFTEPSGPCPQSPSGSWSKALKGKYFEPRDVFKGNGARAAFYFYTMYTNHGTINALGDPTTLYKWHVEDGVEQIDRTRNHIISQHQNNYNPYIEYPEAVCNAWLDIVDCTMPYVDTVEIEFCDLNIYTAYWKEGTNKRTFFPEFFPGAVYKPKHLRHLDQEEVTFKIHFNEPMQDVELLLVHEDDPQKNFLPSIGPIKSDYDHTWTFKVLIAEIPFVSGGGEDRYTLNIEGTSKQGNPLLSPKNKPSPPKVTDNDNLPTYTFDEIISPPIKTPKVKWNWNPSYYQLDDKWHDLIVTENVKLGISTSKKDSWSPFTPFLECYDKKRGTIIWAELKNKGAGKFKFECAGEKRYNLEVKVVVENTIIVVGVVAVSGSFILASGSKVAVPVMLDPMVGRLSLAEASKAGGLSIARGVGGELSVATASGGTLTLEIVSGDIMLAALPGSQFPIAIVTDAVAGAAVGGTAIGVIELIDTLAEPPTPQQ